MRALKQDYDPPVMSRYQASFFERIYQHAHSAEELPWHRDAPPELLQRAIAERHGPARALDLGCGSGLFSVYLARRGYDVTSLDFSRSAVAMARQRAEDAGVRLDVQEANVLLWEGTGRFDVVLDSGCLHGLSDSERQSYKANLMRWLAPGGDYVLDHFERRHVFDWRPVGPRRIPAPKTIALFQPELELVEHESFLRRVPLPVGPTIQMGSYWFRLPD